VELTFVLRQNDVLSYHKEQAMGVGHNIVHLYRQDGYSQQEAYDKVDDLLKSRYRQWYISQSELPVWGENIAVQVQQYIKGCQDVILGNLNWRYVLVLQLSAIRVVNANGKQLQIGAILW